MRSTNASGIVVLAHCLSTNSDYPLDLITKRQLQPLVGEYHSLINHMARYDEYLSHEVKSLKPALERIRTLMEKYDLLYKASMAEENYEHA